MRAADEDLRARLEPGNYAVVVEDEEGNIERVLYCNVAYERAVEFIGNVSDRFERELGLVGRLEDGSLRAMSYVT